MADKLFDVLLNLRAKFFVRADEKSKKLTEELSDWAILNVLSSSMRQNSERKTVHLNRLIKVVSYMSKAKTSKS